MQPPPSWPRLTEFGRRLRRTSPWLIDALLATLVLVVSIASLFATDQRGFTYKDPGPLAIVLVALAVAPLYFRRRAPVTVFVTLTLLVLVIAELDYQSGGVTNGFLIALYTVGAYAEGRARSFGVLWTAVSFVAAIIVVPEFADNVALNLAVFAAAFLFGSTVRNRRLYTAQLEERAAALEHERDEEAQRAVADERLRIARELHDVVAHSMGVIAVQAGVGAHVIDSDPAEARRSLDAISQTSRSALAEIRRMLGALRDDAGAPYVPAPGLDDLDRLVRDVAGAGLAVEVQYHGSRTDLPPGVDLTAYRIVQEALTNVLKHAGPARATVVVGYEPSALRLEILDDGRGVNGRAIPGGHGLIGMRERVGVYGGSFEGGPRVGGGFRVAVCLPYGELE